MKKSILTLIIFSFLGLFLAFGEQIFEHFTEEYGSADMKNHTLLVLKYRPVVENEPGFTQDTIDPKTLAKFIKKENEMISKYNEDLKIAFEDYYKYPFLIIDEKELANYPSSKYPYAYKRYPHVKHNKLISYSRFFINRRDKILYKEINLFSAHPREIFGVEKDIVYALSEFLHHDDKNQQVNGEEKK